MTKTSKKRSGAPTGSKADNAAAGTTKHIVGSRLKTTASAAPQKAPSKQQQLAALVVRDEGATLDEMIATTGWLPHTTRAALTGLKKKGYAISSDKVDGARTYRGISPE